MKILILAPRMPWPPRQGTAVRNWNIATRLALRHEVSMIAFGDPSSDESLRAAGIEPFAVGAPASRPIGRRAAELLSTATPDLARRLSTPVMADRFARALRDAATAGSPFEVIQVEGLEMAGYVLASRSAGEEPLSGVRLIYDAHNAEWVLQDRAWRADLRRWRGWPGAGYSIIQTAKLRRYEARLLRTVHATVAVSRADRAALERLAPSARIVEVPNGVDTDHVRPGDPDVVVPDTCVFVGKMDFRPNIDAVAWCCREVWPRVRAARPTARLDIVGRDPVARVRALAGNGVTIVGEVEDVRPHLSRAAAVIVPLRVGGGTRLKILEAMAMAKPIVATSMAAEGIDVSDGDDILLADDPETFARGVVEVLQDARLRERIGVRARALVEARYRWDDLVPRIETLYA